MSKRTRGQLGVFPLVALIALLFAAATGTFVMPVRAQGSDTTALSSSVIAKTISATPTTTAAAAVPSNNGSDSGNNNNSTSAPSGAFGAAPPVTTNIVITIIAITVLLLVLMLDWVNCCAAMVVTTVFFYLVGVIKVADVYSGMGTSTVVSIAALYVLVHAMTQLPVMKRIVAWLFAGAVGTHAVERAQAALESVRTTAAPPPSSGAEIWSTASPQRSALLASTPQLELAARLGVDVSTPDRHSSKRATDTTPLQKSIGDSGSTPDAPTDLYTPHAEEKPKPLVPFQQAALAKLVAANMLISSFIDNMPQVALATSLVTSYCREHGLYPSQFLMSINFGTLAANCFTIGTSSNLIISGLMEASGMGKMHFYEPAVVNALLLPPVFLYLILGPRWLLPRDGGADESELEMQLAPPLHVSIRVNGRRSPLCGLPIREAIDRFMATDVYSGASLFALKRDTGMLTRPAGYDTVEDQNDDGYIFPLVGDEVIAAGDTLELSCTAQQLRALREWVFTSLADDDSANRDEEMVGGEAITRSSGGRSEAEREHEERLLSSSGGSAGNAGMGRRAPTRHAATRGREFTAHTCVTVHAEVQDDAVGSFVVNLLPARVAPLSELNISTRVAAASGGRVARWWRNSLFGRAAAWCAFMRDKYRAQYNYLAVLCFAVFIGLAMADLDVAADGLIGVVLLVGLGVVGTHEALNYVDLEVLVMVGFSFGIGAAVRQSGLADLVGWHIANAHLEGIHLLYVLALVGSLLNNVISNKAALQVMVPLVISIYKARGEDPLPGVMQCCALASYAVVTPYGFATNLIVMGPGGYKGVDYLRFGGPLNAIAIILLPPIVQLVYPQ